MATVLQTVKLGSRGAGKLRHFVLRSSAPVAMPVIVNAVTLPPELERFADQAIATGRYRTMPEVVEAVMTLLQEAQAEFAAFVASLDAAEAEGERDGFFYD